MSGAAEVQCGTLSERASLELLLRTGGVEEVERLLECPPPAAVAAVKLCGRLPLALGIAGATRDAAILRCPCIYIVQMRIPVMRAPACPRAITPAHTERPGKDAFDSQAV